MPTTTEAAPHIVRDSDGVAWSDDTNVKVVELAQDHLAYGWSAEAIHEQFPHLTMAQIHAALAFSTTNRRNSSRRCCGESDTLMIIRI